MADIYLTPDDNVVDVLKAIREQDEQGIRVFIPVGSPLLDKQFNLQLITREAENMGKKIAFGSKDAKVREMLGVSDSASKEAEVETSEEEDRFGFVDGDIAAQNPEVGSPVPNDSVGFMFKFKKFLPNLNLSFLSGSTLRHKKFIIPLSIFGGVVLIGVVLFAFFFVVPRATITLYVNSEQIVKTVDILASSSASTTLVDQKIIPARKLSVQKEGTKIAKATGEALVGEKARGTVTIYNQTDQEKNLDRGTGLGAEDLQFVLASSASVEPQTMSSTQSAEGQLTVTYTAGRTNVGIIAADLGDQYNLSAGTEFLVASFSKDSVYAKNDEALSGGFSKKVTTVSEQDVQAITESLTRDLEQAAYSELDLELPAGYTVPQGVLSSTVLSSNLSKGVGEEADEVRLQMSVESSALAYSVDTYEEVLRAYLESKIPENYALKEDSVQFALLDAKRDGDDLIITAKVKAHLVPSLDLEQIKYDLAGSKVSSAHTYLTALPNVTQVNIGMWPVLPSPFRFLPKRAENIKVEFGVK